jgi:hypothetical protein
MEKTAHFLKFAQEILGADKTYAKSCTSNVNTLNLVQDSASK